MAEVYMCLYCNERIVGDWAWIAHLRSEGHGAAEKVRGFDRLDLTKDEVFETAEELWREAAEAVLEEDRLNLFESK